MNAYTENSIMKDLPESQDVSRWAIALRNIKYAQNAKAYSKISAVNYDKIYFDLTAAETSK